MNNIATCFTKGLKTKKLCNKEAVLKGRNAEICKITQKKLDFSGLTWYADSKYGLSGGAKHT